MLIAGQPGHVRSELAQPDWEVHRATIGPAENASLVATLAVRERYRDEYWREHDPIAADRLLWRAQTFRHTVHLLPGQTILELGCGEGMFTAPLLRVTRGENPLTAATFQELTPSPALEGRGVEYLRLADFPGPLAGRKFDCIVAMDLLDGEQGTDFLRIVFELLAPAGELVCYESNPWNPIHHARRLLAQLAGRRDPRRLVSRPRLYELLSEIGFIRVYAVFNDFVFPPLTRSLIWWLRNLSILLENAPGVSRLAGSILLHAQKPPRKKENAGGISLAEHASLRDAVSVVIPCRNEEMNLAPLITRLLELYGGYIHEVIAVDDGSTDGTKVVLAALADSEPRIRALHRAPPPGVGRALTDGLHAARGRYVLTMDCDFEHLLPELRDMFDAATLGYDVVSGSRFSRHSVLLNYPFLKIFSNRSFHLLARLLLRHTVRDTTNNLKLLRREVVSDLVLKQPGFAANAEIGLEPVLLGYKVREIPISWIDRAPGMGRSSFRLMHVGGGYGQVLFGLWRRRVFGAGPYRHLVRNSSGTVRS